MKILVFTLILVGSVAQARDVKEFNRVLIENVQTDINNDNDFAFRKSEGRKPASVIEESNPEETKVEEEKKIDRMNQRQFGPSKW